LVPGQDKFVVDVAPIGKSPGGAIGRKTTTYRNVRVNDTAITALLKKNKLKEEILFADGAREKEADYWKDSRHEKLTKTEQSVYDMIDTCRRCPYSRSIPIWPISLRQVIAMLAITRSGHGITGLPTMYLKAQGCVSTWEP
jgi:hypothetical protein